MTKKALRALLAALVVAAGLPAPARGAAIAIGFDNATVGVTLGGPNTYGWQFSTTASIHVVALGLWDARSIVHGQSGPFGDGLDAPHRIALWDVQSPSVPLVSVVVPRGRSAALISGFRYVDVTRTTLEARHDYVIAAEYHVGDDGFAAAINNPQFVLSVSDDIVFGGRRWGPWTGTPEFPGNYYPGEVADFGPNFRYVPEPSLTILGLVACIAGACRYRRRVRPSRLDGPTVQSARVRGART